MGLGRGILVRSVQTKLAWTNNDCDKEVYIPIYGVIADCGCGCDSLGIAN